MPEVFVAVGSNLDPVNNVRIALSALKRRVGDLTVSTAWRNAPQGFEGPDFVNLVVGFNTELTLSEVLSVLQAVEGLCGRPRKAPKFEPRTMDLDLLIYGDTVCATHVVTLPRPDLVKRAYMLGPLAEIAPNLMHPILHQSMSELWKAFDQNAHKMAQVQI